MKPAAFEHYLDHPSAIDEGGIQDLEQLVQDMPYFQIARMMLAAGLRKAESVRYNSRLRLASAYAGDRGMLRRLVAGAAETATTTVPASPHPDTESVFLSPQGQTITRNPEETQAPAAETLLQEEEMPNAAPRMHGATPGTEAESLPDVEHAIGASADSGLPADPEAEDLEAVLAELPEDALLQLLSGETAENVPAEPVPAETRRPETETEDEELRRLKDIVAGRLAEIAATEEQTEPAAMPEGQERGEALLPGTEQEPIVHAFPDDLLLQGLGTPAYDLERAMAADENPSAKAPEDPVSGSNELIDRFLRNQPRIGKPRKEFFNPVDKARKSTTDSEEIVSETLALLQWKQGNHTKAIKIYEKLSLNIPEKSAYFAAQIAKIQESLSNN